MIKRAKNARTQVSDSIIVGIILAFSGGYMDAYTYLFRGEVFANAQTGNMILFGIHLWEGSWGTSLRYLFPIISFVLGIFMAQFLRLQFKNAVKIHWRQITIALEIIVLFMVGFVSKDANFGANSMVSFACGIQVQSFRKIHGNSLATTMCIGNLRAATELLCSYWHDKDKQLLRKSFLYYGIIFVFVLGAVFGNIGIKMLGQKAILLCPLFLLIVFVLMLNPKDIMKESFFRVR